MSNEQNPEALYLMGKLHEEGYSVDLNVERAISYLHRAADLGLTKALTKLAHYHYSGFSDDAYRFPMNKARAFELYE